MSCIVFTSLYYRYCLDLLTRVQAIDNTSALNLSPSVSLLVVSYSLAANNLTFLSHRKTKGKHRKASWNLSYFDVNERHKFLTTIPVRTLDPIWLFLGCNWDVFGSKWYQKHGHIRVLTGSLTYDSYCWLLLIGLFP